MTKASVKKSGTTVNKLDKSTTAGGSIPGMQGSNSGTVTKNGATGSTYDSHAAVSQMQAKANQKMY